MGRETAVQKSSAAGPRAAGGPRTVLFFPSSPQSLFTTLLPLAIAARDRCGVRPVVFLRTPDEQAIERLDGEAVDYEVIPAHIAQDYLPMVHAQAERPGALPGLADVPALLRIATRKWRHLSDGIREADRIVNEYEPLAVYQVMESVLLEAFVNRAANARGIPTILVQWARPSPKEVFDHFHQGQYEHRLAGIPGVLRPLHKVRRALGRSVVSAVYSSRGVRYPRSLGDGNARRFAVMNAGFEAMFRTQGVAESKLVATGHPEDDVLFDYRTRYADASARAQARTELGLDPAKRTVIYVREAVYPDGLISRESDEQMAREVLAAATDQHDTQVFMKMHPRDTEEYYAWVDREFPQVVLVKYCDLYKAVAISDVYLSQGSSTTRWALVLGIPTLMLGQLGFEFTEAASQQFGIPLVRTADDLRERLATISSGNVGSESPESALQRSLLDGAATDRILRLAGLDAVVAA